jgi:hypothetical protein
MPQTCHRCEKPKEIEIRLCADCLNEMMKVARKSEFRLFVEYITVVAPEGTDFSECTEYGGYLLTLAAAVEKDVLAHPERYANQSGEKPNERKSE